MSTPAYSRRYTVAAKLNREERDALRQLVQSERLPAAQIVRRLIWKAAEAQKQQPQDQARP